MKAPDRPPPLTAMAARKTHFEVIREELFPKWKSALEAAEGNVTHAGVAFFPDLEPDSARHRANRLTRRFGLVEFARELRIRAKGYTTGPRPQKENP